MISELSRWRQEDCKLGNSPLHSKTCLSTERMCVLEDERENKVVGFAIITVV